MMNHQSYNNRTLLRCLSTDFSERDLPLIKFLCSKGADPYLKSNRDGMTPVDQSIREIDPLCLRFYSSLGLLDNVDIEETIDRMIEQDFGFIRKENRHEKIREVKDEIIRGKNSNFGIRNEI